MCVSKGKMLNLSFPCFLGNGNIFQHGVLKCNFWLFDQGFDAGDWTQDLLQLSRSLTTEPQSQAFIHLFLIFFSTFYKYKVLEAGDGLAIKSTGWSFRRQSLIPTTRNVPHNCLELQFQKIQHLLVASSGIACMWYTDIQAGKTCKIINDIHLFLLYMLIALEFVWNYFFSL